MTDSPRVWLIIGSSTGFGRSLTEAVLQHGDIVMSHTSDGGVPAYGW